MVAWPAVFAAMQVGGGILQAGGQYAQGSAMKNAYDFNAQVSEENARAVRQSGLLTESQKRRQYDRVISSQKSQYASRGVVVDTGSPLDVMVDSMFNAEFDLAIDRYNTEVAARSYENQAQLERYYGKQTKRLATTQAIGTLLNTGASAYSTYKLGMKV